MHEHNGKRSAYFIASGKETTTTTLETLETNVSEPDEDEDDTLHRLENAMAAIRRMPIPQAPTFSMPIVQIATQVDVPHATDHVERERPSYQTWVYVLIAIAASVAGLWFIIPISKMDSDRPEERVAFDEKPAPLQSVNGLVLRSDIKEVDFSAEELDRIDIEDLWRFSNAIAELKLDFQKQHRFSGYERLEKLIIAFTVKKRAPQ